MLKLERNLLSVALASALFATAPVQAQTADQAEPAGVGADQETDEQRRERRRREAEAERAQQMDQILVTGIRSGIEKSIDIKMEETSIVEAISAEDIGKLPDVSIAESIARLPGLAAQRVAGRASTISIRGLADDFATVLLNGREQVSVGHNRGVEFDQYPSELINGVVVYKTPDASLVGQGLAGTVDLRTVRPLAFPGRVRVVNVRGEKNSLGELNPGYDDTGYRGSFAYIDQFMDDTLGVAIGFARLDSPGQAERWEAWGYPTVNIGGQDAFLIGGSKSQSSSTSNVRDGVLGVIEYDPGGMWSTTLDVYWSKFEKAETLRFMETGLGWGGVDPDGAGPLPFMPPVLSNPVVENGAVISGTLSGVSPVLRNDRNTQDDRLFAFGWNHRWKLGEDWTVVGDVSFSSAERNEMILETYAGLSRLDDINGDGILERRTDVVDFIIDPSTGLPTFNYGQDYTDPANVVLTDPGGWGQDGFIKFPQVEDELRSFRLNAERAFTSGMFSSFEAGVNYADREKTRASGLEAFLRLLDGPQTTIPSELLNDPVDLSYTGIPGSISYDIDGILALYRFDELVHPDVLNKNWTVEEQQTTGFVQWNIDTEWGAVPVRGNIGVQVVHTDQNSNGFVVPFGQADAPIAMSGGDTYNDYLPSLNLAFSLPADQVLRFAAARQTARPRLDDLRANANIGIDTQRVIWTGGGGNPELKPWRANALDLSYEKYFGGAGYFSAAAFYKDLRSYIFNQTVAFDFSGFTPRDPNFVPDSPIGEFTRPENGEGGELYGYELALSVPLGMWWDPLEGFGVIASYSDTHSSIKPLGPDGPDEPIPGLSEEVYNLTLYYERHGFSARVSQRSRSDFLGEVQGFGGDRSKRFIRGEDIVDFQTSYEFGEVSRLHGLTLLLQVNNLTNEPYREYYPGFAGLPSIHNEYGRTVLAGLIFKF